MVNGLARQLEVFRHPVLDAAEAFWHSYSDLQIVSLANLGASVSPLAKPEAAIAVAALFLQANDR